MILSVCLLNLDTDKAGQLNKESIKSQVAKVTKETNTSHVMTYGDKKLEDLVLSTFMGTKPTTPQKQITRHMSS